MFVCQISRAASTVNRCQLSGVNPKVAKEQEGSLEQLLHYTGRSAWLAVTSLDIVNHTRLSWCMGVCDSRDGCVDAVDGSFCVEEQREKIHTTACHLF